MGEEVKVWAALLGNFGLPIVFVLWYFIVDRPAQRKREEAIEKQSYDRMVEAINLRDKVYEQASSMDRQHQMEVAKLQGDIHLSAARELSGAISKMTDKMIELVSSLNKVMDEYRNRKD